MAALNFGIATRSLNSATGYRSRTKFSGRKSTITCIGWDPEGVLGPPKAGHLARLEFKKRLEKDSDAREAFERQVREEKERRQALRQSRVVPDTPQELIEYLLDTEAQDIEFEIARMRLRLNEEFFAQLKFELGQLRFAVNKTQEVEDRLIELEALEKAIQEGTGKMTYHSDHDSGHDSGHDSDHDVGNYIRKRNPRGMTVKKDIINRISKGKGKLNVQWNVKGLPIGENSIHLINFLGSKVKQMIPITITTWVDTKNPVLKKQKHELWLTIQKYFDVDDSKKDWIMKEAGKLHKYFRTALTKTWLKDDNGNINWNPPPIYSGFISEEDWHTFVRIRTEDPNFLKASQQNRKNRGGATPYQHIEERLLVESGKDPTKEGVERHVLWVEGRLKKENEIVDPKTKEVSERIEATSQSVSQGELTDCSEKEIVTRALGREEYLGRTRGAGFGINPTEYFGPKQKVYDENYDCPQLRKMMALYESLQAQLNDIRSHYDHVMPPVPFPATHSSARDSCTMSSTKDNNECECELYISNPYEMVAIGFTCNELGPLMHNLPLPQNHVRVRVAVPIREDAPLPVPIDSIDILTVLQAVGTFVAWPSHLVVIRQNAKSKKVSTGKKMSPLKSVGKEKSIGKKVSRSDPSTKVSQSTPYAQVSQPASPPKVTQPSSSRQMTHPSPSPIVSQPASSSSINEAYRNIGQADTYEKYVMKDTAGLIIMFDEEIFGFSGPVVVGREDFRAVCDSDEATGVVMNIYVRYLYEDFLVPSEQTHRFLLLCPESTTFHQVNRNLPNYQSLVEQNRVAIQTYITDRFYEAQNRSDDALLLAPVNLGRHWVLFAINPSK